MPDTVRIGDAPPPPRPPRSSRILLVVAALVLLAAASAWLAGVFGESVPPTTIVTTTRPTPTTLAGSSTTSTTTMPLEARLAAARTLWASLGIGDAATAAAAFPAATPSAIDLMGFVAAFQAGFMVSDCVEFPPDAAQCTVTITDRDLLAIGAGSRREALVVEETGKLQVPGILGTAAARLSLLALEAHGAEIRAACPVTLSPLVPGLAIAGSATPGCGAFLAGLVPEYLAGNHDDGSGG
jgi:hypothetical protein